MISGLTTTPIECFHGHTNFFHELTRVVGKKNSKGLWVLTITLQDPCCGSSSVVPRLVRNEIKPHEWFNRMLPWSHKWLLWNCSGHWNIKKWVHGSYQLLFTTHGMFKLQCFWNSRKWNRPHNYSNRMLPWSHKFLSWTYKCCQYIEQLWTHGSYQLLFRTHAIVKLRCF